MQKYTIGIPVSALYEADLEFPDMGDFSGTFERDKEYEYGTFDGTFTTEVLANSKEEALAIAQEEYEKADTGDLKDFSTDFPEVYDVDTFWRMDTELTNPDGSIHAQIIQTNDFRRLGEYDAIYNPAADLMTSKEYDDETMQAAEDALYTKWTDSHVSECSVVMLNGELCIEFLNEYDDETSQNCQLSADDMYRRIADKAAEIAKQPFFDGTQVVAGCHIGTNDLTGGNHELIVFIPASAPKEQIEQIASYLDTNAYQLLHESAKQKGKETIER